MNKRSLSRLGGFKCTRGCYPGY